MLRKKKTYSYEANNEKTLISGDFYRSIAKKHLYWLIREKLPEEPIFIGKETQILMTYILRYYKYVSLWSCSLLSIFRRKIKVLTFSFLGTKRDSLFEAKKLQREKLYEEHVNFTHTTKTVGIILQKSHWSPHAQNHKTKITNFSVRLMRSCVWFT